MGDRSQHLARFGASRVGGTVFTSAIDFARIYESYRSFRKQCARWREVGYLEA